MTEYYNMKDCFDACGDDDIPFIEGGFNDAARFPRKSYDPQHSFVFNIAEVLSDKWQIQRAEPKILTRLELLQKIKNANRTSNSPALVSSSSFYEAKDIENAITFSEQNGQLREWIRHKELREACAALKITVVCWDDERKELVDNVLKALANLKAEGVR